MGEDDDEHHQHTDAAAAAADTSGTNEEGDNNDSAEIETMGDVPRRYRHGRRLVCCRVGPRTTHDDPRRRLRCGVISNTTVVVADTNNEEKGGITALLPRRHLCLLLQSWPSLVLNKKNRRQH